MRTVALVVLLASVACASGGAGGGTSVSGILRLAGSSEPDPPRDGSEYFVVDTVRGTAERAFNAVRYTYEALGIGFSYYDPDQRELGGFVEDLRELDHEPPSAWIDCGEGAVAGNNADHYYVTLTVGSRVLAVDSGTSTVETAIRARSRQRDHSSQVTRCVTLGTLEGRIADRARALLRRYGPGTNGEDPT
jgi:hypothetical protein